MTLALQLILQGAQACFQSRARLRFGGGTGLSLTGAGLGDQARLGLLTGAGLGIVGTNLGCYTELGLLTGTRLRLREDVAPFGPVGLADSGDGVIEPGPVLFNA